MNQCQYHITSYDMIMKFEVWNSEVWAHYVQRNDLMIHNYPYP
jgi:hypothetical protein